MGCDVLTSSMQLIQKEYLALLKKYERFDADEAYSIQNECRIFWLRHKREIDFFLNNFPCDFDTCVFIGGMYLNVVEKREAPFLSFGKKHISDDPVAMLVSVGSQEHLAGYLKKSIKDDIEIIQKYNGEIFVLPLSYLFVDKDLVLQGADNAFWRLFSDSTINKDSYLNKFSTVNDVIESISEDAGWGLFLRYEKPTLKERYLEHLETIHIPLCDGKEGVDQFYHLCIGLFAQATSVMEFCIHYWTFPFIRDGSLFGCFCLFLANLIHNSNAFSSELKIILNKAVVHNLFYRVFEYEELENLETFFKTLKDTEFEKAVLEQMQKQNVDCSEPGSFSKINAILINEMNARGMPCGDKNEDSVSQ